MTWRALASRGAVAAWLLLLLEAVVVLGLERRAVTSVWEVQWGLLGLAPIALLASGLCGAVGGVMLWLAFGEYRTQKWCFGVALGCLSGAAAWSVGGGRHLVTLGARGSFALGIGLASCAVAMVAQPLLCRTLRRDPRAISFVAGVVALNLEIANLRLLVRLYPGFHWALAGACCVLAPWLIVSLAPSPSPSPSRTALARMRMALPWLAMGVACVLAQPGARSLSTFDNLRWLLVEKAPLLGHGVRLGAALAPPPPIRASCLSPNASIDCAEPTTQKGRTFSLVGRDLLLITIDAVRADHVGAYGYSRRTTPNIDELARSGVRFAHAYAATAHTSYSVTSLMTGKYMRPLLLQGAGVDSDTWATLLQRYGIRTAAFYPPAVFFIDPSRFESFQKSHLGFEYRKVEFLEGSERAEQVQSYLDAQPADQRLFVWVHLFSPHEPYEKHREWDFGERDIDRYDSEIAYADDTVGRIVSGFRRARPEALVIVSSDHGEEFGDHGGRYHGTTVYEEQVRVPLVVNAPTLFTPHTVQEPVQTIDLLPTILNALDVPRPPRIRGRDLGVLLTASGAQSGPGLALAETEEQLLLAEGAFRLVCSRQLGACKLFNLESDPLEQKDASGDFPSQLLELRQKERELAASHGQFEAAGLRAEGRGWPQAILRGVAGDGDAVDEIAALIDDADPAIRRKAAELLFELHRPTTRDPLILALSRDEDPVVKAWSALALTRLGHGAPLVVDLLTGGDRQWRRLAALALAEAGDRRGGALLVDWWRDDSGRSYQRSRELLSAIGRIRWRDAVIPLCKSLGDVRLRPAIASALADIGDEAARGPLVHAFAEERYQAARVSLADSLTRLKAKEELVRPLIRFMGVPDAMPGAVGVALRAGILEHVGGPNGRDLRKLQQRSTLGVTIRLIVPRYGNGTGLRVILRASNPGSQPGEVRIGLPGQSSPIASDRSRENSGMISEFAGAQYVGFTVAAQSSEVEQVAALPPALGLRPGLSADIRVLSTSSVRVEGLAVVPFADEIPPPAPEPWKRDD